jgi:hypothetical protein
VECGLADRTAFEKQQTPPGSPSSTSFEAFSDTWHRHSALSMRIPAPYADQWRPTQSTQALVADGPINGIRQKPSPPRSCSQRATDPPPAAAVSVGLLPPLMFSRSASSRIVGGDTTQRAGPDHLLDASFGASISTSARAIRDPTLIPIRGRRRQRSSDRRRIRQPDPRGPRL